MWVEDLPNGKYKYVERYTDPLTGKQKKVSLTHIKKNSRVEKELLVKLHARIDERLNASKQSHQLTLRDLTVEWLAVYKEGVKLSSYTKAQSNLNALNASLGDVLVEQLKASHFNQFFLTNLQSGRFVHSSANQIKSNLSRVLQFGQTYYGFDMKAIISELTIPKINVTAKNDLNYLEPHELKRVIDYYEETHQPELKRMVILQANTGMRFGEMMALDYKESINLEEHSIHITETYDYSNYIFTTPKSGDKRLIYFSSDIAQLVKDQIRHTQLLTMSRGLPKTNTRLFKTMHGNAPMHRVLNNTLPNVGLDKEVKTHTLRHTFISLAVERGMNKELIAKQVGHSDTTMIDQIYSHFTDGMQKQQKKAMLEFNIL